MLSRAFEWYRVVTPKPQSQTIDNRIASVNDIIKEIDEAKEWDIVFGCVAGVVSGFDSFPQESPTVEVLIRTIKSHESAFPGDLAENALAVRACAAIALGEILVRHGEEAPEADALVIASAIRAGLGVRPEHKGKYMKQLLDELGAAAARVLQIGGEIRRHRNSNLVDRLKGIAAPADMPAAWKAISPVLLDIARQVEVNQEELNALWWFFSGQSNSSGKALADLPTGAAALCCGVDIANQALLPPTENLEAIVRRGFEGSRKAQDLSERSIEKIVADWESGTLSALIPDDESKELATKYPVIFPLSWLCNRLLANQGAKGWGAEFQKLTGLVVASACTPSVWANQIFRERVAQRIHNELAAV
jgi:hypothetical protein